jgi:hypothetical protein
MTWSIRQPFPRYGLCHVWQPARKTVADNNPKVRAVRSISASLEIPVQSYVGASGWFYDGFLRFIVLSISVSGFGHQ